MNWKKDLIKYRREKAAKTLEDASTLFDTGSFFSTVNRIYYALFYEVTALLLTRNLSSAKHSGIRSMFNEHFVKTGIVDVEIGKFFSRMFDFRQKGDYADFIEFKEAEVKEWLKAAQEYLKQLEQIITNQDESKEQKTR